MGAVWAALYPRMDLGAGVRGGGGDAAGMGVCEGRGEGG